MPCSQDWAFFLLFKTHTLVGPLPYSFFTNAIIYHQSTVQRWILLLNLTWTLCGRRSGFYQYATQVVVITTAQLHATNSKLRFCAASNPNRGMSEIRGGEDMWQWSRLEIRLNGFRRSTIPQKQFNSATSNPK